MKKLKNELLNLVRNLGSNNLISENLFAKSRIALKFVCSVVQSAAGHEKIVLLHHTKGWEV